jgi:hypothetical protein
LVLLYQRAFGTWQTHWCKIDHIASASGAHGFVMTTQCRGKSPEMLGREQKASNWQSVTYAVGPNILLRKIFIGGSNTVNEKHSSTLTPLSF